VTAIWGLRFATTSNKVELSSLKLCLSVFLFFFHFVHLDVNTSTHNGTFVQFTHKFVLWQASKQGLETPRTSTARQTEDAEQTWTFVAGQLSDCLMVCWSVGLLVCCVLTLVTVAQSGTAVCVPHFSIYIYILYICIYTYIKALRPQHFWQKYAALLWLSLITCWPRGKRLGEKGKLSSVKGKLNSTRLDSTWACVAVFHLHSLGRT